MDAYEADLETRARAQARKALAVEHRRRADWRKRELSANSFQTEYHHSHDFRRSHSAHDLVT
ncbi:hypothetical protein LMTR13_31740 [Bradyrhizobium icense]|uniref:Uncharacterized protein n=1 Tax=Bradyrhizobium icense TaxID=1274631 RepID=A0A1B1UMP6_9BRAD|nr:hypothetical protein LMTR13_31740 [Bradyrhizobium icense]